MRNVIKKFLQYLQYGYNITDFIKRKVFLSKRASYIKSQLNCDKGKETYGHVTLFLKANAGDSVLSECVRKTIQGKFSVGSWKIYPVRDSVSEITIDSINNCSKLWLGGGGLFLPDSNPNMCSGWQWPITNNQIDKIKVPIIVFSVGYNYFPGQVPNDLFKSSLIHLIQKSRFVGLRNNGSVNAVRALIPDYLQNKVVYQPCTTTLIRKLYSDLLPSKKETGKIAINMAFDREEMRYGSEKDVILNNVAKAIKEIQNRGYQIHYVCHSSSDRLFLQSLKKVGIKYKLNDMSFLYPLDVMKFYNEMDVVIGMRGHAQMIPFGVNTEIISLGTHDKMKWFLEDINSVDWYIDLKKDSDLLDNTIMGTFIKIHEEDKNLTKTRLLKQQEKLWNVTQNNLQYISEL